MTKYLVAVALAGVLAVPEAASQSLLQKNDWQPKTFESYLPAPSLAVPWLERAGQFKTPNSDQQMGWRADAVPSFVRRITLPNAQMSSNAIWDAWRM